MVFEKIIAWFRPSKAERDEALRLNDQVRHAEHGHTHAHIDGVVHSHDHVHGDHEHDHEHDGSL